jgi:hypothetical protein
MRVGVPVELVVCPPLVRHGVPEESLDVAEQARLGFVDGDAQVV